MIKENIDISIIIPVHNSCLYLEACIDSVLNSIEKFSYEILLVINDSTDGSEDICSSYEKKYSRINVFSIEGKGVSLARNYGLSKVMGKYVCFVDSDDIVEKEYFSLLFNSISNYKADVSMVGHKEIFENGILVSKFGTNNIYFFKEAEILTTFLTTHLIGWNVRGKMFRTETLQDITFDTDLDIGEDMLFLYNLIKHINSIIIVDIDLYYYRMFGKSAMNSYDLAHYFDIYEAIQMVYADKNMLFENEYKLFFMKYLIWFYEFVSIRDENNYLVNELKSVRKSIISLNMSKISKKIGKRYFIEYLLIRTKFAFKIFVNLYRPFYFKKRIKGEISK